MEGLKNKYHDQLHIGGGDTSTVAFDFMAYHNNMNFSTKDRDNDRLSDPGSCAKAYKSGWWYDNCHRTNSNGPHQIQDSYTT